MQFADKVFCGFAICGLKNLGNLKICDSEMSSIILQIGDLQTEKTACPPLITKCTYFRFRNSIVVWSIKGFLDFY